MISHAPRTRRGQPLRFMPLSHSPSPSRWDPHFKKAPPPRSRYPPNQTVALVGIRCNCEPGDLKKVIDALEKHLGMHTVPPLIKDKSDVGTEKENRRHIIFLNCKSQDDAKQVCQSLNEKPNENLGIEKYKYVLQAVTKPNLSALGWDELAQVEAQTVEGKISQEGRTSCKISDQFCEVIVEKEVFEGSADVWNKLQVGDVLRVTAEKGKGSDAEWKAKDAVLVSSQASRAADEKAAQKAAEAAVLEEAGQVLNRLLIQNLRGKGWMSLQTIGPWFNGDTDIKNALQIVKAKHKQLKNFVAENPLVEMKEIFTLANGTDFLIALAEDIERERASLSAAEVQKQQERSVLAKNKVQSAEIVTADETKDEQEGRARSYRIQRAVLELVPQIFRPVLCHAWEQKTRKPWSMDSSGSELWGQMKNQQDAARRIGKHGLDKIKAGQMEKWDITLFALLLLNDPGLLPKGSSAYTAVKTLRAVRNDFVHEVHSKPALNQDEFDKQWEQIRKPLGDLSTFVGSKEVEQLLKSESSKILEERVDAQKEHKYNKEFEHMHSDLLKLEEKLGGMEDDIAAVKLKQQNCMTKSVVGNLVSQMVAAKLAEQQSASSTACPAGSGSTLAAVHLDMLPGQTFSFDFRPDSRDKLGNGAQGSVYKAKCGSRVIALKIPDTQAGSSMSQREWQNLKAIKHKNVVSFIGRGSLTHGGRVYDVIGMEMAVGTRYDAYLSEKGGKLSWQEAAEDFRQIISGMGAVHAMNILHRDLKGANIIRKKNGDIVIVDFGLSKDTTSLIGASTSVQGRIVGTPAYCSPESGDSKKQSPASDVFTMGIILYESVSGYLPWSGDDDASVRSKLSTLISENDIDTYKYNRRKKPAATLDPSEAPQPIIEFVLKCLATKPQDRFPCAGAMLEPWDSAVEAAKATVKEQSSEAQRFWEAFFGEDESEDERVELEMFKRVVMEQWGIADDAAQELAVKIDADQNGSIEAEEFLKHFSDVPMAEVARQAQELAHEHQNRRLIPMESPGDWPAAADAMAAEAAAVAAAASGSGSDERGLQSLAIADEAKSRGACKFCGKTVFSDQPRSRDDSASYDEHGNCVHGMYWHLECAPVPAAPPQAQAPLRASPKGANIAGVQPASGGAIVCEAQREGASRGQPQSAPVGGEVEARGRCKWCMDTVFTSQPRSRDERGAYFHLACSPQQP